MIYHKIPSPFFRDEKTNKLITWLYISKEVELLSYNNWIFTDKVDWTNIRVYYDWYNLEFKWRTEKSEIPKGLLQKLQKMFKVELFEQCFWTNEAILYWEGYGWKIQWWIYNCGYNFKLFDVYVWWVFLERENIENVAISLWIDAVPIVFTGSIKEAIDFIKTASLVEWLVWVPEWNFLKRNWERIIVKIKNVDFIS